MDALPPLPGAPLRLFDSMARAERPFAPIDADMVRLYSCGPTVYDHAHLGNLRAYVFTDTLRRTLNWKGWAATHVINITDVGHLTSDADEGADKMEAAAGRRGQDIWQVAAFYTDAFKADLAALNVRPPTLWSVATAHVQDMIAFARRIEAAGAAYELEGGLYFDTARVPDYGLLARAAVEGPEIARIEAVAGKRNPADFALWRRSPPGERRQMEWQSPWGPGAPGWHLECSVMSMKYLGPQFDIHTGGIDHREIHHCNEIAQNQAYTGTARTGANFWMHNNFLVDHTGKMSKSGGGFATLAALVDRGVAPLAYRLMCLSAHYRSELLFSTKAVGDALVRLKRLMIAVERLRGGTPPDWLRAAREAGDSRGASLAFQRETIEAPLGDAARAILAEFDAAISEDLATPRALPLLESTLAAKRIPAEERLRVLASIDLVLGLDLVGGSRRALSVPPAAAVADEAQVLALVAEREAARAARDFAGSDALRARLDAMGVEVMDGDPLGWEWRPTLDD
ncbi:MAG: cysteine--tRNA ligase [Sphingomonas fennica]